MTPHPLLAGESHEADLHFAELIEEVLDLWRQGQIVSVVEAQRRWPEHAQRLESIWPTLRAMVDFGAATEDCSQPPPLACTAWGALGDFRILGEIGRGGMGVVYAAEQMSLRRRVALKVLPFAAVLDSRRLQRFKTEAQAAAGLHHTNIVPVYAVGCDRGVHYYAMQFIEGRTLEQVIQEASGEGIEAPKVPWKQHPLPSAPDQAPITTPNAKESDDTRPAVSAFTGVSTGDKEWPRFVAQIGIQVAEALDHAHGLGVTHRDIKPSNLILDAQGNIWVTDFGLAQMESEASLTMTGEVVGTLRYMSPEQAVGQRGVLDHRTDVYSLGVTLYELLALRPAFSGKGRADLLRQVIQDDPASLRKAAQGTPRDLETIISKAVAKDPAARYPTAAEMAADLNRFVRGSRSPRGGGRGRTAWPAGRAGTLAS